MPAVTAYAVVPEKKLATLRKSHAVAVVRIRNSLRLHGTAGNRTYSGLNGGSPSGVCGLERFAGAKQRLS
jgi:hypothetical protein